MARRLGTRQVADVGKRYSIGGYDNRCTQVLPRLFRSASSTMRLVTDCLAGIASGEHPLSYIPARSSAGTACPTWSASFPTPSVSVAATDVTGDGVADVIGGQASGGSKVRVLDGVDFSVIDGVFEIDGLANGLLFGST